MSEENDPTLATKCLRTAVVGFRKRQLSFIFVIDFLAHYNFLVQGIREWWQKGIESLLGSATRHAGIIFDLALSSML